MSISDKLNKGLTEFSNAVKNVANNYSNKATNTVVNGYTTPNNNSSSQTNTVKTNTSWNGGYLNVDLNTDYSKLIKAAEDRGDYAQAANFEALRNAKINYLNSIGNSIYPTTSKYITPSKFANNQGGVSYNSNQTMDNLISGNAGTYNINGITYRKNADGTYEQKVGGNSLGSIYNKVGDGYNSSTGEFTFSNINDAKQAYLNQMLGPYTTNISDAYDSLVAAGKIDPNYLTAIMEGTTNAYTQNYLASAEAQKRAEEYKKWAAANNVSGESDTLKQKAKAQAEPDVTIQTVNEGSFEKDTDKYYETRGQSHTSMW